VLAVQAACGVCAEFLRSHASASRCDMRCVRTLSAAYPAGEVKPGGRQVLPCLEDCSPQKQGVAAEHECTRARGEAGSWLLPPLNLYTHITHEVSNTGRDPALPGCDAAASADCISTSSTSIPRWGAGAREASAFPAGCGSRTEFSSSRASCSAWLSRGTLAGGRAWEAAANSDGEAGADGEADGEGSGSGSGTGSSMGSGASGSSLDQRGWRGGVGRGVGGG
jgi:hypothetical protein